MIDPITFAAAFILVMVVHILTRRRRRRARIPEFDGGFRHDHGIRITRVKSPYITTHGDWN